MTVFGLKRESKKKKKCYVFSSKGNYLCKTPEDNKTNLKCVGRWFSGPLDDVVFGSPEFNYSATLVHAQLVCLPPAGILNLVMFILVFIYHCFLTLVLKSPIWEWPISHIHIIYFLT